MTSRERVLRAFGRRAGKPDRMPLQFDLSRALGEAFARRLGLDPGYVTSYYEDLTPRISANGLRTALGSDCVVVGGAQRPGFAPARVAAGATTNEFGMHVRPGRRHAHVVRCPLEDALTAEDVEAYPFPAARAPGRFDAARRDVDRHGGEHFVIGDVELSLFELAGRLAGVEKYLMAVAMGEAWVDLLDDRVERWTTELALQLLDAGVDALWFGEDLGTMSTPIAPETWRARYKPRHARMIRTVKARNPDVLVIMHSDGAVAPLLEDFIEIGVEVYNPVQPDVAGSDPQALVDRYGGRIRFFGGIDHEVLLPSGDRDAIAAELARRARILGPSGYLMAPAHVLQADVSVETVELMIQLVRSSPCG